jgi:hypothetical protein
MDARKFGLYIRLVTDLSDQYATGASDPRERFELKTELAQRVYDAIQDTGDPDPSRFPPRRQEAFLRGAG